MQFLYSSNPSKKKKGKEKEKKERKIDTKSKYLSTLLSIKPVKRGSKQVKIFKVTTSILSTRILTTSACTCITISYLSVLSTLINWHTSCQVIDLTDMHMTYELPGYRFNWHAYASMARTEHLQNDQATFPLHWWHL